MDEILQNEIKRQEYMEIKYKSLDEEMYKPDDELLVERTEESNETEMKYMEETFMTEKLKILEELGLLVNNNDLLKHQMSKEAK